MDFRLNFSIPKSELEIKHGNRIALLGSCFSDSMSQHFSKSGFEVETNPFGTIFHPTALSNCLHAVIDDCEKVDVVQRNDLFFSWDSAESVVGYSEQELIAAVIEKRKDFREYLKTTDVLVVTFGTAWGYYHTEVDVIVGNNHKMPASLFDKCLMEVEAELNTWKKLVVRLKELNPSLNVLFTVSPIRHAKDGLTNNNRSKARLIEMVHAIVADGNAAYFPSYEIVMDELRDYRFFKECRIHPTPEAVKYVWTRFEDTFFSGETKELAKRVQNLHRTFDHRTIHSQSIETKRHITATEEKLRKLKEEHPNVWWS